MDGTVSILDRLPFEMVAIIGHHAGRSTLYNLRLTCKTMANITELTFAKRFFSERRHIFSRHSLEELVAITAHPVFGCHVHAVILGQTRLLIPGLADLILFHGNRSDRTAIGEHREILDEQEILDHGGEALRLLTQAMTNISHHHDMITVGTWPDILIRDQTWEPWDPKETGFNEYHCQGCDTWLSGAGQFVRRRHKMLFSEPNARFVEYRDEPKASLEMLLHAATKAGCKVDTVKLCFDVCKGIEPGPLDSLSEQAIVDVRVIDVATCSDLDNDTEGFSFDLDKSLFKSAINVEKVRLDFTGFGEYNFDDLAVPSMFSTKKLRRLHLSDVTIREKTFMGLLAQHKRTLQHLSLLTTMITGTKGVLDIDWTKVLPWMSQNLLELTRLSLDDMQDRALVDVCTECATFEGPHEVHRGLQDLLQLVHENRGGCDHTLENMRLQRVMVA